MSSPAWSAAPPPPTPTAGGGGGGARPGARGPARAARRLGGAPPPRGGRSPPPPAAPPPPPPRPPAGAPRFWRADFALERIADGEHFRCYDQPGVAKLVLCFRCTPSASGTLLHTETRVFCPDRASRLRFTPYWLAIRPVSGLIRRRLLAGIERRLG
ncbi:hypothetical protein [Pseudomonas aeruginosa]|uniref:hypothetical protein n=1 Tax=Pseudomonas aeruginosa TaxID=287 RepID=UPI00300C4869